MVWRYSIANKTSGQNIQNPNNRLKKLFSELQELDVRICVHPNFPIIILILLNSFHKFQRSRGLISSEQLIEKKATWHDENWDSCYRKLSNTGYAHRGLSNYDKQSVEPTWIPVPGMDFFSFLFCSRNFGMDFFPFLPVSELWEN